MERRAGQELEEHGWQLAGERRRPELTSHPPNSIPTLGALADSVILNPHITSNPKLAISCFSQAGSTPHCLSLLLKR